MSDPVLDLLKEAGVEADGPLALDVLKPSPAPWDGGKLGTPTEDDAEITALLREAAYPSRGGFMRGLAAFNQTGKEAPGKMLEGIGIGLGSETIQQAGADLAPEPRPYDVQPHEEGVATNLGRTFASGLTLAPAAALGGPLAIGAVGGGAAAQAIPDAFYGAKANGADDTTAWRAAMTSAIPQGAIEAFLGPERLIGKIAGAMAKADKATGGAGRELLVSSLGEGAEEVAQNLWGDIVAQDLYDVAPDEDWSARFKKAGEAGLYGMAGGAFLGSVALGADKIARAELPPVALPEGQERSPPVYDPIERELTTEETGALESWKEARNATEVEAVERPEMAEATELARKAGFDVLFVKDNGAGLKEGATIGRTIILPADADAATVGLATATHEAVHAMPESKRKMLIDALDSETTIKKGGKRLKVKSPTGKAIEQASAEYGDRAEAEGVKVSKADLREEGTADLAAALSPVVQRVMRNPSRATALMLDKPSVMVQVLDIARKWAGQTTHAQAIEKEIEKLSEVRSQLAKGMTGRQRVQAAQGIVEAFNKIGVEVARPVKPKAKPKNYERPIGPDPVYDTEIGPNRPPYDAPIGPERNPERGMVPVRDSDRSRSPQAAAQAGALTVRERQEAKARRAARMSGAVSDANQPYRPGAIQVGDRQGFDDYRQLDTQELSKRARQAQADEDYEAGVTLGEAGFTPREQKNYATARRRARMAQRAMDSARTDAQAESARAELLDSSKRLERYESRLTPEQRQRLRSTPDPEVYDRALAARQAGLEAKYSDLPEGAARLEELQDEERRGLDRAVPSVRYSLRDENAKSAARSLDEMPGLSQELSEEIATTKDGRVALQDGDGDWHAVSVDDVRAVTEQGGAAWESLPADVRGDANKAAPRLQQWLWDRAKPIDRADVVRSNLRSIRYSLKGDRRSEEFHKLTAEFDEAVKQGDAVKAREIAARQAKLADEARDDGEPIRQEPKYSLSRDGRREAIEASMNHVRAIRANVDAWYANEYDHAEFQKRADAAWGAVKPEHELIVRALLRGDLHDAQTLARDEEDPTFPPRGGAKFSLRTDVESAAREATDGYMLANAGKSLPERVLRTGVRNMLGTQGKTTAAETSAAADAILQDGEKLNNLLQRAYRSEPLSGPDQIALDRFARSEGTEAFASGNVARLENAIQAEAEFQLARSQAGRALGDANFRDALQSPHDRAMKLLLTPSRQVMRRYRKAKTWQARNKILREEAEKVEKVRYALAEKGFDPRLIPEDYFKDPRFAAMWAESFADGKANGKWDWYIQWRRAAMLSGPITTIRNVTGNTSFVTYDRVLRLAADSIIPGSETEVGDVREYVRDLFASMAQGWGDAKAKYRDFYAESTEGTSLDEHVAMRRGGIAGKALVGLEAVGVRAQAAQDVFFRTVVGAAETRLRARQKARKDGGSADDWVTDPDVLSMANEDMERALFLDRDNITRAVTGIRDALDSFVPVGSTLIPFAATPTKIVQRGGETMLGPLGGFVRDREKHGTFLLGTATWAAMLWVASMFDDEDGLPMVTGSRARGGAGEFQDRTAPAYSIRVGDTYYSYQSIEPLSTALAAVVDGVQSENPLASISSFVKAAKDKSFFRAFETVYDAIEGSVTGGERGVDRAAGVARDLLWTPMIPNVVKSPVRATDTERRKELGDRLEVDDFLHAAIPNGEFGPPLRYDLWGRPAEKAGGSWVGRVIAPVMETNEVGDVEKIDLLLARYNVENDTDKFFSAPSISVERNGEKRYWSEDEYSELARDSGRSALAILRPWAAEKSELTERDLDRISEVLARTRKQKVRELLSRQQ